MGRASLVTLVLALSCTTVPVMAQTDPLAQAIAADRAGDPALAIRLLEPVVAAGDDADALRVLGVAYSHAGRQRDAVSMLRRAQTLAPRDQDIAAALARALAWSGARRDAGTVIAGIAATDPNNVDLPSLRDLLRAPQDEVQPRLGVSASFAVSRVTTAAGHRTWRDVALAADAHLDRRTVLSGSVEHSDRAGLRDDRLAISVTTAVAPGVRVSGGLSATPDADFRERWGVQAGAEVDMAPVATILVDVRHLTFAQASTTVLQPGVRLQTPSQRVGLSLRSIILLDERGTARAGASARGDLDLGRGYCLVAGGAVYPDTEAGVTRSMRSVYAGIAIPLSRTLIGRLTVDHDDRRNSYKRTGVSAGIGWRFGK